MRARIIRKKEAAALLSLEFPQVEAPSPPGVQPFQMRRVHPFSSAHPAVSHPYSTAAPFSPRNPSESDVEAIRKQSYEEGYAAGERAAAQHAAERFQTAIDAFGRTVEALAAHKARLQAEAERELVALAFAIARRIIRRELTLSPETVLAIIRTCLEEFQRAEMHRLQINPQDLEIVKEYFRTHPVAGLEIVPDPSVSRGGGVFETSQGRLDARIESQLSEIEYGLADG